MMQESQIMTLDTYIYSIYLREIHELKSIKNTPVVSTKRKELLLARIIDISIKGVVQP